MTILSCPNRTTLLAFLEGRLPQEAIDRLARHLEDCPRCPVALEQLERALEQVQLPGDTLQRQLGELQGQASDVRGSVSAGAAVGEHLSAEAASFLHEAECGRTLARLQRLWEVEVRERPPASREVGMASSADVDEAVTRRTSHPFVEQGGPRAASTLEGLPGRTPGRESLERVPVQLGAYRILEELGGGGMGVVYKAMDRAKGVVALKTIRLGHTAHLAGIRRFHREVEALLRLNHPNIVRLYDADQAGDVSYLVMEYVEGENLHRLVQRRGHLDVEEACGYILQTARALQHACEHGFIHRDIKPGNLMRAVTGEVKVCDLGLALIRVHAEADESPAGREWQAPDAGSTESSTTVAGTPEYMAPELWSGRRGIDTRVDIYALGCTLYHLLVGHPPFAGPERRSPAALARAHCSEPPPKLADERPVPDEIERIYQRCLQKDLSRRYRTPGELADDLEIALERLVNPSWDAWVWKRVARAIRRGLALLVLPFQRLLVIIRRYAPMGRLTRPRVVCVLEFFSGNQARCLVDIDGTPLPVAFPAAALIAHGLEPNSRFEWRMRRDGEIRARDIRVLPDPSLSEEEWRKLDERYQKIKGKLKEERAADRAADRAVPPVGESESPSSASSGEPESVKTVWDVRQW
jgi:serine/threonine protein kinase